MPTSYIRRGAALRSGQSGKVDASPIYIKSSTGKLTFVPASTGSVEVSLADSSTGFLANSPTAPIGFATGAGGTATQITSRATPVTMVPNPCLSGTITTTTSSLAGLASADFVVTDSAVAIGDVVLVSIQSGSNSGATVVSVSTVTAGTFTIRVSNTNAAAGTAETGAIIINFAIIKAVSA
jgi:hypothetical protein